MTIDYLHVAPASPEHAEQIAEILTVGSRLRAIYEDDQRWPNPYPPELVKESIPIFSRAVIVGLDQDNNVATTLTISTTPNQPREISVRSPNPWDGGNRRDLIGVGRFATHPNLRNQCLGAAMLNAVEHAAAQTHFFTRLMLHCAAEATRLRQHYRDLGFEERGSFRRIRLEADKKPHATGYTGVVYGRGIRQPQDIVADRTPMGVEMSVDLKQTMRALHFLSDFVHCVGPPVTVAAQYPGHFRIGKENSRAHS